MFPLAVAPSLRAHSYSQVLRSQHLSAHCERHYQKKKPAATDVNKKYRAVAGNTSWDRPQNTQSHGGSAADRLRREVKRRELSRIRGITTTSSAMSSIAQTSGSTKDALRSTHTTCAREVWLTTRAMTSFAVTRVPACTKTIWPRASAGQCRSGQRTI